MARCGLAGCDVTVLTKMRGRYLRDNETTEVVADSLLQPRSAAAGDGAMMRCSDLPRAVAASPTMAGESGEAITFR